jgi:hypothetical protein
LEFTSICSFRSGNRGLAALQAAVAPLGGTVKIIVTGPFFFCKKIGPLTGEPNHLIEKLIF